MAACAPCGSGPEDEFVAAARSVCEGGVPPPETEATAGGLLRRKDSESPLG